MVELPSSDFEAHRTPKGPIVYHVGTVKPCGPDGEDDDDDGAVLHQRSRSQEQQGRRAHHGRRSVVRICSVPSQISPLPSAASTQEPQEEACRSRGDCEAMKGMSSWSDMHDVLGPQVFYVGTTRSTSGDSLVAQQLAQVSGSTRASRTSSISEVACGAELVLPEAVESGILPFGQSDMDAKKEAKLRTVLSCAAGGAVVSGSAGGVVGTATGSAIGAAIGIVPAFFTFGLSIPLGAVIGGATGLFAGAAVGSTSGLLGGAALGGGMAYAPDVLEACSQTLSRLEDQAAG